MQKLRGLFPYLVLIVALFGAGGCSKQTRAQRSLARVERDLQDQQYDKAEVELLNLLKMTPPPSQAVAKLGLLYFSEGKLPQACAFLQKACALQPDNIEARAKLGLSYLGLRDFKNAREQALLLLDRQADNADALVLLGTTALNSNLVSETAARFESLPETVKSTASFHIAKGSFFEQQLDFKKADIEFKSALALAPNSSEAYVGLADVGLVGNDLVQAESALKQASQLAPIRSSTRLRYAGVKVRQGDLNSARLIIQPITTNAPDYIPAWVFLAQLSYAQRQYDKAGSLANTVLTRDPINLDALVLKGDLLMEAGQLTNAITQYQRILENPIYNNVPAVQYKLARAQLQNDETPKAFATLNQLLTADPTNPEARVLLAGIYLRRGEFNSAVVALNRLLSYQPRNPQACLMLARVYFLQKRLDDAAEVYRRMEQLFPENPEPPYLLGLVLSQQTKDDDACKAFMKALQIAPQYLLAVEGLVDLDLRKKDFPTALRRVQKELDKNANSAAPWLLKAKVLMKQAVGDNPELSRQVTNAPALQDPAKVGLLNEAESAVLEAIQIDPVSDTSYLLLAKLYVAANKYQQALDKLYDFVSRTNDVVALMQLGAIQERLQNYSAARDAYEKILTVNPNSSVALNNLAYLYSERLAQPDRAYVMAQNARRLLPYEPHTADTLGWILFKKKEYARALGLLEEAAVKLADAPEVQLHLGMAYYMLGEEEPARSFLEMAVHSTEGFPDKEMAVPCLRVLNLDTNAATPAVLDVLVKRLNEEENDPVAFSRLGVLQERTGDFAKAAQTYERALEKNSQNTRLMMSLARIYSQQLKKPERALDLAKRAHDLAPEDPYVSHLLGQLVFRSREPDYSWVLSLLEDSARKLPTDPGVAYDLAYSYYSLGRVTDAEAQMQKAVQAGQSLPQLEDARSFLQLAPASEEPARITFSEARAQEVLKSTPDSIPALMALATLQQQQEKYHDAAQTYEHVLSKYQSFLPAIKRLASLNLYQLKNEAKAFELAAKLRQLSPSEPEASKLLGIISYHRDQFENSVQFLEETAQIHPKDADSLYYLGMAHYRLKDSAKSKEALQRALELNLRDELAGEARQALLDLK